MNYPQPMQHQSQQSTKRMSTEPSLTSPNHRGQYIYAATSPSHNQQAHNYYFPKQIQQPQQQPQQIYSQNLTSPLANRQITPNRGSFSHTQSSPYFDASFIPQAQQQQQIPQPRAFNPQGNNPVGCVQAVAALPTGNGAQSNSFSSSKPINERTLRGGQLQHEYQLVPYSAQQDQQSNVQQYQQQQQQNQILILKESMHSQSSNTQQNLQQHPAARVAPLPSPSMSTMRQSGSDFFFAGGANNNQFYQNGYPQQSIKPLTQEELNLTSELEGLKQQLESTVISFHRQLSENRMSADSISMHNLNFQLGFKELYANFTRLHAKYPNTLDSPNATDSLPKIRNPYAGAAQSITALISQCKDLFNKHLHSPVIQQKEKSNITTSNLLPVTQHKFKDLQAQQPQMQQSNEILMSSQDDETLMQSNSQEYSPIVRVYQRHNDDTNMSDAKNVEQMQSQQVVPPFFLSNSDTRTQPTQQSRSGLKDTTTNNSSSGCINSDRSNMLFSVSQREILPSLNTLNSYQTAEKPKRSQNQQIETIPSSASPRLVQFQLSSPRINSTQNNQNWNQNNHNIRGTPTIVNSLVHQSSMARSSTDEKLQGLANVLKNTQKMVTQRCPTSRTSKDLDDLMREERYLDICEYAYETLTEMDLRISKIHSMIENALDGTDMTLTKTLLIEMVEHLRRILNHSDDHLTSLKAVASLQKNAARVEKDKTVSYSLYLYMLKVAAFLEERSSILNSSLQAREGIKLQGTLESPNESFWMETRINNDDPEQIQPVLARAVHGNNSNSTQQPMRFIDEVLRNISLKKQREQTGSSSNKLQNQENNDDYDDARSSVQKKQNNVNLFIKERLSVADYVPIKEQLKKNEIIQEEINMSVCGDNQSNSRSFQKPSYQPQTQQNNQLFLKQQKSSPMIERQGSYNHGHSASSVYFTSMNNNNNNNNASIVSDNSSVLNYPKRQSQPNLLPSVPLYYQPQTYQQNYNLAQENSSNSKASENIDELERVKRAGRNGLPRANLSFAPIEETSNNELMKSSPQRQPFQLSGQQERDDRRTSQEEYPSVQVRTELLLQKLENFEMKTKQNSNTQNVNEYNNNYGRAQVGQQSPLSLKLNLLETGSFEMVPTGSHATTNVPAAMGVKEEKSLSDVNMNGGTPLINASTMKDMNSISIVPSDPNIGPIDLFSQTSFLLANDVTLQQSHRETGDQLSGVVARRLFQDNQNALDNSKDKKMMFFDLAVEVKDAYPSGHKARMILVSTMWEEAKNVPMEMWKDFVHAKCQAAATSS